MRGFHFCQYCVPYSENRLDQRVARGNGEIRVRGPAGIVYAAPVLICHYIKAHNYRPPDEFLEAIGQLTLPKIAIIAALEREIHPLIKNWRHTAIQHDSCTFTIHQSDYAIAICGGIGPESARRAAEAVIQNYFPSVLISAGIAGALIPELHVGETVFPALVIDTSDGSRHQTTIGGTPLGNTSLGHTVLATYPEVATAEQKRQLAKSYGAHAVDMEAAAVARAAQKYNLPFLAVKAISDELEFEIPGLSRFIQKGQFKTSAFIVHIAIRPWLWLRTVRLARNTHLASENLCAWLRESALTNTIVIRAKGSTGEDARGSAI
jgi:nucleoside phosphorylase